MLSLFGTHTTYPVIVQTKKVGDALWVDTSAGSKFFDAARRAQHRRRQPLPVPFRQTSRYALGIGAAPEGEGRRVGCAGAMGREEVFFVTFYSFLC